MVLLVGALTVGLILSLLALGVFVSFRVFSFADITADGSITLGAAVAAILVVNHVHPLWATAAACVAGAAAGATTGVIHTRFGVDRLLSGILVMTALYSINLHVMGKSNVPLLAERTLTTIAEHAGARLAGGTGDLQLWGWALSHYPYIVPDTVTIRDSAAPRPTLVLLFMGLCIGTLILLPALRYLFRLFAAEGATIPAGNRAARRRRTKS